MDNREIYNLHAEVFKAMGNPLRIKAIELLNTGEMCFSDIREEVGGLKSTLSQNLSIMVDAGILKVRKDSRCNYYTLSSPKVYKACQMMREVLVGNLEQQNKMLQKIKTK